MKRTTSHTASDSPFAESHDQAGSDSDAPSTIPPEPAPRSVDETKNWQASDAACASHPKESFVWPKPRPKSEWRGVPAAQRWPWSNVMFIDHPDAKTVVEDTWTSILEVQRSRRSKAMLILGESGAGKTRLAENLIAQVCQAYGREDPEKTVVPALLIEIPEGCSPRGFCVNTLQTLGDPDANRRRVNVTRATSRLINACEVRLIVIDNLQDIPTRRRERGIEQVGIRLRELIDQTECLWLFLGTSPATAVIDSESQLVKRTPYRKSLRYFSLSTGPSAAKRYLKLLYTMDDWLPLAETNRPLLQDMAGGLFIASEGVLDRLERLLGEASWIALSHGREQLAEQDLLRAFATVYGTDVPNPFAKNFVTRNLKKRNEPFSHFGSPRPKKPGKGKSAAADSDEEAA